MENCTFPRHVSHGQAADFLHPLVTAPYASESSQASWRSENRPAPPSMRSLGRAVLDDPAVLEDQHPVGDLHGGQPVGDDHRGPVGQDRAQRALHQPLGGHVERGRRLVEDQHGGVGEERAGERDELALTGRQPAALVGDVGVVALRQPGDEVVGADRLRRRDHLGRRWPRAGRSGCCRRRCRRTGSSPGSPSRRPCAASARRGRAGRRRRAAPGRRSGRRTGTAAWRSWSCRRRSCRPARGSARPGRRGRGRAAPARPRRTRTAPARSAPRRARRSSAVGVRRLRDARAAPPARRTASPARRWPTGTCCRTARSPASARRTAAGRAGTRPARRRSPRRRRRGRRRTAARSRS